MLLCPYRKLSYSQEHCNPKNRDLKLSIALAKEPKHVELTNDAVCPTGRSFRVSKKRQLESSGRDRKTRCSVSRYGSLRSAPKR